MTFVTSDGRPAIVSFSEASSDPVSQITVRSSGPLTTASAFELLFSQQLQATRQPNGVEHGDAAGTNSAGTGHDGLRLKAAGANDSTPENMQWNPQAIIIRPILIPKLIEMPEEALRPARQNQSAASKSAANAEESQFLGESSRTSRPGTASGLNEAFDEQTTQSQSPASSSITSYDLRRNQGPATTFAANLANQVASRMSGSMPSAMLVNMQAETAINQTEGAGSALVETVSSASAATRLQQTFAIAGRSSDSMALDNSTARLDLIQASQPMTRTVRQADQADAASQAVMSQLTGSLGLVSNEAEMPITAQLAAAIAEELQDNDGQGPATVRIQLDQPGLGKLTAILSISSNRVSIRMVTENVLSQQIVACQLDALRQSLTKNGITCDQCQVDCEPNDQPASARKDPFSNAAPRPAIGRRADLKPSPVAMASDQLNFVA